MNNFTLTSGPDGATIEPANLEWVIRDDLKNAPVVQAWETWTEGSPTVYLHARYGRGEAAETRRWLTFPACALVRLVRAAMRGLAKLDRLIVRVAIREGFVTDRNPEEADRD